MSTPKEPASTLRIPKAFISYSWTSPQHQTQIKEWTDRLVGDGVDVLFDLYDLKEGADKFAYMEQMVTDPSVTHVLVFLDKAYAEKADKRKGGAGTESQIISKEIYDKINQDKFIPITCGRDETGEPFKPLFFKSRIHIDFTTPEAVNENWEQLIRLLFGKPMFSKPSRAKPPAYLSEESAPQNPAAFKFRSLSQSVLNERRSIDSDRRDFLDAVFHYVDELRIRKQPDPATLETTIIDDFGKLKVSRNLLIDWIMLEGKASKPSDFENELIKVLERLLEMRRRPQELNSYNEVWFEAHRVFVYETFLYIIATLLKIETFPLLNTILRSHYLEAGEYGNESHFKDFSSFFGYSELLKDVLVPGQRLYSPAAELIKRGADRADLPFSAILEADAMCFLMALIAPKPIRWFPQTLVYASRSAFPFFIRAAQRRGFRKLAEVTRFDTADALREAYKIGYEKIGVDRWSDFNFHSFNSFENILNVSKWDTVP